MLVSCNFDLSFVQVLQISKLHQNYLIFWKRRLLNSFMKSPLSLCTAFSSVSLLTCLLHGRIGCANGSDIRSPPQSVSNCQRTPHDMPAIFISFSTVLLHVCLGRPLDRFPAGFHRNACLVVLLGSFLMVCPIHFYFLSLMV